MTHPLLMWHAIASNCETAATKERKKERKNTSLLHNSLVKSY